MDKRLMRAFEVAYLVVVSLAVSACSAPASHENSQASASLNWMLPTTGGSQFWTDVQHRSGWRIQRHFATGHFRLLDAGNFRQAWGTQQQCAEQLNNQMNSIPANQETVLILAHGMGRTANSWGSMTQYVQAETNWQIIPFAYASTRKPIHKHAVALAQLIQTLGPEVKTIHLVGHSLGSIVIRHYLADTEPNPDSRLGRFIMIGPPNQGSRMARILYPTLIFPLLTGPSGVSLGRGWEELKGHLSIPTIEFGIIAGGHRDNSQGWNPLLKGASDGTVSLTEALLPGASDVMVRPLLHSTMMNHPEVCRASLRVLRTGCFTEDGIKHPVQSQAE
jgi:pimeloyl-ACP methyl ester carboxylesterase